ncbi:hypothetical protein [Rhizobium paknamense]|uniref:Heparinase II/III-like protein n=1 Tax=Rhizobium paknamense TaxID=1206817 RepID=A0ABU0II49_9HYPH|nr:hypothetical protein [Rhizobium paknamense]MDQ0457856.1 hypothetical protein [Rhizobium paknamense]
METGSLPVQAGTARPLYRVGHGETVTAWLVSDLIKADFPGIAAPAEDRVRYRFINGFVDVGDLPCRKAFWATMVGRRIFPERDWPVGHINLPGTNRRVEFTHFWHVPTHVRRWLSGCFVSPAPRRVTFRLSTCGGVRIWVNGEEQVRFEPFQRNRVSVTEVTLSLQAGDNEILLHSEDLAERDTVWFFELELLDDEPLTVVLPVAIDQQEADRLEALVRDLRPERDVFVCSPLVLIFDRPADRDLPVSVEIVSHGHDRAMLARESLILKAGETRLSVPHQALPDGYHGVKVKVGEGEASARRSMDAAFMGGLAARPAAALLEDRKAEALRFSARHGAPRIGRLLAMAASGQIQPQAFSDIMEATLASIDRRDDCSDFIMVPLLWLVMAHPEAIEPPMLARIRHSVLNYRYWVDEPGNDAMWFWSENHVLCFHTSQLLAGLWLPEAIFTASGRTGAEQAALATARLGLWFDAVEPHGLAEWNSAAYYPIDFIGLLALEHWAGQAISARARHLLDLIFEMVALHTLGGVPAGSQGRAYDKELRAGPLTELAPFAWVAFGQGWLNGGVASLPMFAAGRYCPPERLMALADLKPGRAIEARYTQGLEAAHLVLFKNDGAQLSTVVDHKTGKPGHQQHVLDIRLEGHPMARLWVNHPGEDDPWGSQRPSYWAGNGILPRVAQHCDLALFIADVGQARLPWTHAYAGRDGMDEIVLDGRWLFNRSGRGFCALFATNVLEAVENGATAGREFRSPGPVCGWAAVVGSGDEAAFRHFISRVQATETRFEPEAKRLTLIPPGREPVSLAYDGTFLIGGVPQPFSHTQPEPQLTYDSDLGGFAIPPFYA